MDAIDRKGKKRRWRRFGRASTSVDGTKPGRHVRVNFEPKGFGLALTIDDDLTESEAAGQGIGDETDGILHVSNACVTLELVGPQGRRSVLAWDPAEVDWASLQAS